MKLEPIPAYRLQVGTPLPFDVHAADGRLLLRREAVIESEVQLERLLEVGRYDPETLNRLPAAQATDREWVQHASPRPASVARSHVSVFTELAGVPGRIEALLAMRGPGTGFADEVRSIVALLRSCCALDSDASLAHILLSVKLRYTIRHPINSALLTSLLLTRLRHPETLAESAAAAALTMNLSAVGLQEELYHHCGPLTEEQNRQVRAHPQASVEILQQRGVSDPDWLAIVAQHHENLDGSGYPARLSGAAIRTEAQVLALADRYCAMVSERADRPAMLPSLALKELHARHGQAVGPTLIAALIGTMGLYPPGTCVVLENGDVGLVGRRLRDVKHPTVYALHTSGGSAYEPARKRLTGSQPQFEISKAVPLSTVKVEIRPDQLWLPSVTVEAPTPA